MSAKTPVKVFPTWRGMASRPMWNDGSDICRCPDSWLASKLTDSLIFREMTANTLTLDEVPGCWAAAFRGVMHRLTRDMWELNVAHSMLERARRETC